MNINAVADDSADSVQVKQVERASLKEDVAPDHTKGKVTRLANEARKKILPREEIVFIEPSLNHKPLPLKESTKIGKQTAGPNAE